MRDDTNQKNRYPYSLRDELKHNSLENIIDSNIFSVYISNDLSVPKIDDPRKTQHSPVGIPRHPGYVRSSQIDQVFSYIGYIKRVRNNSLKKYLPLLFSQLFRFCNVLVDIIFIPDAVITEDIYVEQQLGLQRFLEIFSHREGQDSDWIENIWKNQKAYLEKIDGVLESLRRRGKVFDFKEDPLHSEIVGACKKYFKDRSGAFHRIPGDTDISFVANCCLKARSDGQSKTIWSADKDIQNSIMAIYSQFGLSIQFL